MKYKSNRKEVKQRMDMAQKLMLEALGKAGEGYVKLNTPVKTGALRGSIAYKTDKTSVSIGSTLTSEDYPIYIEKGTSKAPAQPYISTGILGNASQLKKIAEANYKL
ncbi:HK97-gp10 family putative phage morphogenesis protein [Virgibacillus salexigens]|uniref:HK97-gp10 family putative phage morphogenesis protein n=1 Tax=Virgibacillus salexigens TaxID=61016 RepID=UPI0019095EFF|nr:HK97-gp10 family putative phage morphogenesis protein [Virgibacillus salexigens]